ncbi:hypothetical protein Hanom_Chr16g01426421 [Helianthus anomalus]
MGNVDKVFSAAQVPSHHVESSNSEGFGATNSCHFGDKSSTIRKNKAQSRLGRPNRRVNKSFQAHNVFVSNTGESLCKKRRRVDDILEPYNREDSFENTPVRGVETGVMATGFPLDLNVRVDVASSDQGSPEVQDGEGVVQREANIPDTVAAFTGSSKEEAIRQEVDLTIEFGKELGRILNNTMV